MGKIKRPEGHHTITPSFAVQHAGKVIQFIEQAFGGKVVDRYDGPGDTVMHAEVMIGDSAVMLGEPMPGEMQAMPASLSYYVDEGPDVDKVYKRALELGAKSVQEPANQFYGYRSARVEDVGGNQWTICAVVEEVSKEEMHRRMEEMMRS
jgi:PhnB protein